MFCCSIPSGWTYQTLHRDSKPRTSFINHIFAPLLFLCVLVLSHVSLPHPIWISGLDMEGWPWFVKLMIFPPIDPLPPSSGLSLYRYLVDKFESLTCHRCILEFPGADLKTSTWISWLGLPCSLFYAQFITLKQYCWTWTHTAQLERECWVKKQNAEMKTRNSFYNIVLLHTLLHFYIKRTNILQFQEHITFFFIF